MHFVFSFFLFPLFTFCDLDDQGRGGYNDILG